MKNGNVAGVFLPVYPFLPIASAASLSSVISFIPKIFCVAS